MNVAMNVAVVRLGVVLLAVAGMAVGLIGRTVPLVEAPALPSPRAPAKPIAPRARVADSTWQATLSAAIGPAPFRAARRLADVAYDPDRPASVVTPPVPAAPSKPSLVLSGLVWEREPAAVIEGLPGVEGPRVVHQGEVVGGLAVRRIHTSGVVIAGLDTVWHLTLRTSWP